MSKKLAVLIAFIVIVSLGIAIAAPAGIVQKFDNGYVNWSKGVIKATGMGVPAKFARNEAQAKATARRAAVVDAQRNLGEIIKGVNIDSETTVKNLELESDVVHTRMQAFIKGAQILSEKQNVDGSYEVIMSVPMYGDDSLGQIVYPEVKDVAPAPEAPAVEAPPVETKPAEPAAAPPVEKPAAAAYIPEVTEPYTGLIIDCVGLHVYSAMSPKLIDEEGQELYGKMKVNASYAINVGIVGYWHTMDEAQKDTARVGNHPLVIKAKDKKGEGFFAVNPVIKTTDGLKVVTCNQASNFLNQCKVIFVIDPQFQ
ncbi:MAG: hypothetical protein V2A78_10220 [bacterium]